MELRSSSALLGALERGDMKNVVVINWRRHSDFFKLWSAHGTEPKLVYVIGETHECYIGSVGSRGGKGGLQTRYEKQYLDRACAIFGQRVPRDQPAFAGLFVDPDQVDQRLIIAAEAQVQNAFITRHGKPAALFDPEHPVGGVEVKHQGEVPAFLKGTGGT